MKNDILSFFHKYALKACICVLNISEVTSSSVPSPLSLVSNKEISTFPVSIMFVAASLSVKYATMW